MISKKRMRIQNTLLQISLNSPNFTVVFTAINRQFDWLEISNGVRKKRQT